VIFLTIGTHEPFDRLVRAVDEWCGARGRGDVFGQITDRAGYRPKHFEFVATMPPGEYHAKCDAADFLVAHAGMGSIITALTLAKPIVVMPRRGHLDETRNDHQYATVKRLGSKPGIHVALSEAELPEVMDRVASGGGEGGATLGPFAEERLISALRELIG